MSWFLPQGKGREVFRGWAEGWLRWFAHPFAGVECRPDLSPTSAPSSSEVAVGFLVFLYLVHNLQRFHRYAIILSLLQFLRILLLEETFAQAQALQQRVPGAGLSPYDFLRAS